MNTLSNTASDRCGGRADRCRPEFGRRGFGRRGFTLLELLAVITIIAFLLALLLPATRRSSGAARRMSCANQFKQVGLGLHNYHAAHAHFPMAMGGTGGGGNENQLSGLVALLPYIEQQTLWEQIQNPSRFRGRDYPPMGPPPWVAAYDPWRNEIPTFHCPSAVADPTGFGKTSYAFCVGDVAEAIHQPTVHRGVFACRTTTRFRDIVDGNASTIAMSEIGNPSGRLLHGQFATGQLPSLRENPDLCVQQADVSRPNRYADGIALGQAGRGGRWADGAAGVGLVNTILPPNRPSCAIQGTRAVDGYFSAGSFHVGGAHVLMADGAVVFITDSIDAGDPTARPVSAELVASLAESIASPLSTTEGPRASPYGLWGAMGTAAGREPAP